MSTSTNRNIERYYFEQFRLCSPMLDGNVVYADKPDVRVIGERTVGIEIARLYLTDGADPFSEQVQRACRAKVLSKAQALHRSGGGRSIELNVDFDPATPITNIELFAERLARLARKIEEKPVTLAGTHNDQAEGLRFVNHDGLEYEDAKWRNVQTFSTPLLDTRRLTEVIAEKNKKALEYEECDEYWLLLVVDFMDSAQDQELVLPDDFVAGASVFQKIVLYKPQFAQVLEVPL